MLREVVTATVDLPGGDIEIMSMTDSHTLQ